MKTYPITINRIAKLRCNFAMQTTLCEMLLPERLDLSFTYISFDDPDERLRFQRSAVQILESITTPLVVLDEVQKIPQLFDPLKLVVDRERKKTCQRAETLRFDRIVAIADDEEHSRDPGRAGGALPDVPVFPL